MKRTKLLLLSAILLCSAALASCTQPDRARHVLESQGYTQVEMKGWALLGCSKDDTFHDRFTARSVSGQTVSGVVCSGIFKGATVRLD